MTELEDKVARDRISADLDTTFLVEAGAGSGKTTSLVARMISLIRTGKAEIKEIAAITFTNKAADELRTRFRLKLEKEAGNNASDSEKQRFQAALEQFSQCFIGTIHAFCGQLLRERPIECGLDPAFTELDEESDVVWRNQFWDEYLQGKKQANNAEFDTIQQLDLDVEMLRTVFHSVSQYEDVEIFTQEVDRPDFDLIRYSLILMVEHAMNFIPTNQPEKDWDAFQKTCRKANYMIRMWNMQDDLNILRLAKLFDRKVNITQNRWTDKDEAKDIKTQFEDWQISKLNPFIARWREYVHPKIIQFVLPAVEYSQQRRAEMSMLNFQDLLMKAAELLYEQKEVRAYFSKRITRLFVDEFQDTDPIQAEVIFLLTGSDSDENDWRKQHPRQGSLFIVGDPKQSIYRFRRADISTYNLVKHKIQQSGGEVLSLTANFRSVKAIGDYVNYEFRSKFAADSDDHQAHFVEMKTQQPNPKGKKAIHGVFTMTYPKVERHKKEEIMERDSDRVARWIAWACQGNVMIQEKQEDGRVETRPVNPGDFMILLKHRQFIHRYAEKLENFDINADTSGSKVLYDEIYALYMLAKCLHDTTDRIPLLAVLRGILFGLSDEELYHFKTQAGSISIFTVPENSDALTDQAKRVVPVLNKLQDYSKWVQTETAVSAFYRIVNDVGIIPYAAVQETGAIRSGTILQLMLQLQNDISTASNWEQLTQFLSSLAEQKLEGTSLLAGSGEAVRIMNVHKAKGLEAPIVILANPCGNIDHDATEHVDRQSEPAWGYFTISQRNGFQSEVIAQPLGWEALEEKERAYMHAEDDRLLYVAATRAKQLLIVSQYPAKTSINPWGSLHTTIQNERELDKVEIEAVSAQSMKRIPDMKELLAPWQKWKQASIQPTYSKTSVTNEAKSNPALQVQRSAEGKGMAFGSTVHRLLEMVGNGWDVQQINDAAAWVAADEELNDQFVSEAIQSVHNVVQSEVWQRSLQAKQKFHEFSFTVKEEADNNLSPMTLLNGVIDFLFEEEDGWVIVDFKTDTFERDQLQDFVNLYQPQVALYQQEWEQMLGAKVKESGLYFTYHNKYVASLTNSK